jgi:DNA (cytosine-5)-methyltransferase 1
VTLSQDLFNGIIVDNFAGGGGASTGIKNAVGRDVDIAINHDPAAIAMHKANHPYTEHLCESVWDVDPRKVVQGRPVSLCWLSPDCKHFSKAKGGKPVEKNIRGLAWVAVRWAATVRPKVIILENVEEFKTWGPLTKEGYPDPDQKGRTFNSFVNALKRQGYHVDFRELRACDYGAPTIRKRFFMIARCDGQPIRWPEPTHADPKLNTGLLPWRTAAEIIDWSLPCPSIFDRKKPLAENTLKRIARGIQKFVIENPEPFIMQAYGGGYTGSGKSINDPLPTITARDHNYLVTPFLAQYHSYNTDGARGQTLDRPLLTLDTSNRYALVSAFISKFYKSGTGQIVDEPLHTITTSQGHFAEVRAFLTHYYGTSTGSKLTDPLPTVVSKDRFGLVVVGGLNYQITDIGMRMLAPRELFNAQGFPPDYIIDRDYTGKAYPISAQVARCGNAVPPAFAEALVRVNLPDICERAA